MSKFVVPQNPDVKVLEVDFGDATYNVPLIGSLTFDEAVSIETPAGTRAFIEKHIPKKVLKGLTIDVYNSIVEAWKKESGLGLAPGE